MANDSVLFERLEIEGWRQFKNATIDFHPRLTILTGANGSGKSSILSILAQHFGWSRSFLSIPTKEEGESAYRYLTGIWTDHEESELNVPKTHTTQIGSIKYSNGAIGLIRIASESSIEYAAQISPAPVVEGVFVNSNKPSQRYQRVDNIPTEPMLPKLAIQEWINVNIQRYSNAYVQFSPSYKMKQALISMAMFGPGNAFSTPVPEIQNAFVGFIEVLKAILPESIGFRTLNIRTPDIVFVTDSGEWLIDEASGGISAIIELAWQIFLFSGQRGGFVALIDEPENHLHPSMQRKIMTSLVSAFPQVQFIVATHSPFIISSVKDSNVYVLRYESLDDTAGAVQELEADQIVGTRLSRSPSGVMPLETGFLAPGTRRKVVSQQLDLVTKAGSAGEVLRDVLGVPVTTPDWVSDEVRSIVAQFRTRPFSTETLGDLRAELERVGMGDQFPEALADLANDR